MAEPPFRNRDATKTLGRTLNSTFSRGYARESPKPLKRFHSLTAIGESIGSRRKCAMSLSIRKCCAKHREVARSRRDGRCTRQQSISHCDVWLKRAQWVDAA
jgi:hypothetical protein